MFSLTYSQARHAMNHSQLRAFHRVASEGGFTRAARYLRVSQPTLSAQVKVLEETYGVRLFDRKGRRISLTPLGRDLFAVTSQIFALESEAETILAGVRDPVAGGLTIGADSPHHAMTLLAEIKRKHEGLSLAVDVAAASGVLESLKDYRCDIAVLSNPPADEALWVVPFRADRLVAIVPRGDDLAGGEPGVPIGLGALLRRPLILRERGSVTRDVLDRALAARGLVAKAAMEIRSREAIREAVAAGLGVGVVFASEFGRDAGLAAVPIAGSDLGMRSAVACLRSRRRLANISAAMHAAEGLAEAGSRA
jgi:aminoethylphosphonate catabolism LysR family transcriptional regulator